MQYASVRAENSIQAVCILIAASLPDQCWHFWDASLRRKKVRWKMKCSQLLRFSFDSWAPFKKDSEMRKKKKGLPELVLENSISKETKGSLFITSLPTVFPLFHMFLRNLVPHRQSGWTGATTHWEKTNFHSTLPFPLYIIIFQSAVFCSSSIPTTGYRGWPVIWQIHMQVISHPLKIFCNSSAVSSFFFFFLRRYCFNIFCRDVLYDLFCFWKVNTKPPVQDE